MAKAPCSTKTGAACILKCYQSMSSALCHTAGRKAGELLHEEAILIEATFEKLDVVILEHPLFIDDSVDGKTKAVIAKKALGIDEDALLMEGLGKMGKCAVIWETPEEPELIIPHALLEGPLKFTEQPVMRFKRHRDMPMTQKYCWCSNSDDKEITKRRKKAPLSGIGSTSRIV